MKEKILDIFKDLEEDKNKIRNKANKIKRTILVEDSFSFDIYLQPNNGFRGLKINLSKEYRKMNFDIVSKGFKYFVVGNELFIEEKGEYISNIFSSFISDLLPTGDRINESLYVETLKIKLFDWKDFFQSLKNQELSDEMIKGLFGELYILRNLLQNKYISTTECWAGPNGTRSDFNFYQKRIEVKTTSSRNPTKIKISNEIQLESKENDELFLCLVEVLENEGGENLLELVKSIDVLLQEFDISDTDFYKKLEKLGCSNVVLGEITDKKFKPLEITYYSVNSKFPYISTVPNGVIDLKYSILKDNIQEFRLSINAIFD